MALTIATEILGQEATALTTYCYLYEPLRIQITESDATAKKIYIELEVRPTSNRNISSAVFVEYGNFDINPGQPLSVDLMKLAQQHHNANVYNFSHIDEIVSDGWKSIVSEYIYAFRITSDVTTTPTLVEKLPIIGGRSFPDFVPTVQASGGSDVRLTEGEVQSLDPYGRWINYPYLVSSLEDLTDTGTADLRPTIQKGISLVGSKACAGQVVWKSRLGGWMTWGFKMKKEAQAKTYSGKIAVGMFESTAAVGGNAYIPADYTGINTSYTLTLKELSLNSDELRAVQSIIASPAVYFMKDTTGSLELMRLTSANAAIDNKANGGDFTVSLSSISTSMQKTR